MNLKEFEVLAARNTIPNEVKLEVVRRLACFDTIASVAEAIKTNYGVALSPQAIEAYDPTKRAGRKLASKWRELFDETRKGFIAEVSEIPIAHRSFRLRALSRMAERAERLGNLALTAQLLKQAAEEMGNAYTNRREVTGKDGKDLPAAAPAVAIFALPDNGREMRHAGPVVEGAPNP